jgi:predicted Fe-Mo cluster-binding NifX family protein
MGPELDSWVDPSFGRCAYHLIVDTDTMQYESVINRAISAAKGAETQAAQTMVDRGVQVVISGGVGPNARKALSFAGVEVITRASGTVRSVVKAYKRELQIRAREEAAVEAYKKELLSRAREEMLKAEEYKRELESRAREEMLKAEEYKRELGSRAREEMLKAEEYKRELQIRAREEMLREEKRIEVAKAEKEIEPPKPQPPSKKEELAQLMGEVAALTAELNLVRRKIESLSVKVNVGRSALRPPKSPIVPYQAKKERAEELVGVVKKIERELESIKKRIEDLWATEKEVGE